MYEIQFILRAFFRSFIRLVNFMEKLMKMIILLGDYLFLFPSFSTLSFWYTPDTQIHWSLNHLMKLLSHFHVCIYISSYTAPR